MAWNDTGRAAGERGLTEMRRALIAILMICACLAILGACSPGDLNQPSPTVPGPPEPTTKPSPTAHSSPTPTPRATPTTPSEILATGEQARDFSLPSVWGDTVTLSSYQGLKNVVLVFYRTGG